MIEDPTPEERDGPLGGAVPTGAPEKLMESRAPGFGLTSVRVRDFRSLTDVSFQPGPLTALVGDAGAGKSNLLAAIRTLLDPGVPAVASDVSFGGRSPIRLYGALAGGQSLLIEAAPPLDHSKRKGRGPTVLFLPAGLRDGDVVAEPIPSTGPAHRATDLLRRELADLTEAGRSEPGRSAAAPALALVSGIESCCAAGVDGLVLLIEEPELYLRPQAQRYLYRVLHRFASMGNQVMYSTHSPAFLNVARLEELVLVERAGDRTTGVVQPEPLPPDDELRALGEFDAERGELFLSRAAVLVEGRTEKLVLPFVFDVLGHDVDREAISIVDCGGKSNIPLFARVCEAVGVPCVAVHDRDAAPGAEPIASEQLLNERIAAIVGRGRRIELIPDFEGIAGLRGHLHKPARAWKRFRSLAAADVPEALARVVKLALDLAAK